MGRKSERTRQRILESANRLFYRQGYNLTTFSDIVAASNIPRGNIYYYFQSKEEILSAAIDNRKMRISQMLQDWQHQQSSPIERINRFLHILVSSNKAISRWGCPMGSLNTELGKSQKNLQKAARSMFLLFETWLTEQFIDMGYNKRKANELALRILARGQGISLIAHVYHNKEILEQEKQDIEDWVRHLSNQVKKQ